jgi:DNA-binding LacI/PurR family transcriptional regulator
VADPGVRATDGIGVHACRGSDHVGPKATAVEQESYECGYRAARDMLRRLN